MEQIGVLQDQDLLTQYLKINGTLDTSLLIIEALRDYLRNNQVSSSDFLDIVIDLLSFGPRFLPIASMRRYKHLQGQSMRSVIESLEKAANQIKSARSAFGAASRDLQINGLGNSILTLGLPSHLRNLVNAAGGLEKLYILEPPLLPESDRSNFIYKLRSNPPLVSYEMVKFHNLESALEQAHSVVLEPWGILMQALGGFVMYFPHYAKQLLKETVLASKSLFAIASKALQILEFDIELDGIPWEGRVAGIITENDCI